MIAKATTDREIGPGERAARDKSRRMIVMMGGIALGGGIIGFIAAFVETPAPGGGLGTFPPAFALAAVAVFLALVGYGSWRYFRAIDEVERRNNYYASTWAANIFLIVYPGWYMLWRGGLTSEPMHEVLFAITAGSALLAYLWKRYSA